MSMMHFGLAIALENANQMNLFSFSTPIYLEQQTFLSQVNAILATYYNLEKGNGYKILWTQVHSSVYLAIYPTYVNRMSAAQNSLCLVSST